MADDETWEQEPVNIERRPSGNSVISVRLPTKEFHALCDDMELRGEKLSEWERQQIERATPKPQDRHDTPQEF